MTATEKKERRAALPHAPLPYVGKDGMLQIGGGSAVEISKTYGTPIFVYDRAIITQTFQSLRAAIPASVRIHYAVKANPYQPVIQLMASLVDGLDVASQGELEHVRSAVGRDIPISFAGPGKRDDELRAAIALNCTVNVESMGELDRLAAIALEQNVRAKAAVRVNPPFDLKGSGMSMGGGAKPFGIDHDIVPDVLRNWPGQSVDFQGFHIFTGSQSLSAEALIQAHENAIALGAELSRHAPSPLLTLNIGGGIGVPYFPGDDAVDIAKVGAGLKAALEKHASGLSGTKVIMELGRYLVAEAGVYLARVVDKKQSRGTTFLITDGGLHHQLAVSGNFGQVFRKNYPVAIADQFDVTTAEMEIVSVVGCLCTPLDKLGENVTLPISKVGDVFAVFRCGAYGPTASPGSFLGHPGAQEILL